MKPGEDSMLPGMIGGPVLSQNRLPSGIAQRMKVGAHRWISDVVEQRQPFRLSPEQNGQSIGAPAELSPARRRTVI